MSTVHKIIFVLMVIATIPLILWAAYLNYVYVAIEKNATILADLIVYLEVGTPSII